MGVICVAIRFADVFERPTLRGCQCRCVLGRVKPLRTLTLPCQKTNPVGVICGCIVVKIGWLGKHSGVSVYKVGSCGVICGYMVVKMGWRDLGLVTSERSIMFWWGYLRTCGRGNGVMNVSGIIRKITAWLCILRIECEVLKRRSLRWLFMAEFSMKPRFFRFFLRFYVYFRGLFRMKNPIEGNLWAVSGKISAE